MPEICETCPPIPETLEAPPSPEWYADNPYMQKSEPAWLREAAAARDGYSILQKALTQKPERAHALAELSVTGYSAFRALTSRWTKPVHAWSAEESNSLAADGADFPGRKVLAQALVMRARDVATFLLANDPLYRERAAVPALANGRHAARNALGAGWLSVVPDVDPPHRSINVHGTRFVERRTGPMSFDTDLGGGKTATFTTDVRYVIEGPRDAPLIVLMHGHSSKLEELEEVIPGLSQKYRVLVADQPGSAGYTRGDIAPAPTKKRPFPALSFLTDFMVALVKHVEKQGLARKGQPRLFAGGSLGGHLALRLSARSQWFPKKSRFAAWSPGSAWPHPRDAYGGNAGADVMEVGWFKPEGKMSRDPSKDRALGWLDYAGGMKTAVKPLFQPQEEHWYWAHWHPAVRAKMIAECYQARREIFHKDFRVMHWQLAWEQLRVSHHGSGSDTAPPYASYTAPLLLMAGCEDNLFPEYLATNTHALERKMAARGMKNVRWRGFCATGHSIHNERPGELARVLDAWFATGDVD